MGNNSKKQKTDDSESFWEIPKRDFKNELKEVEKQLSVLSVQGQKKWIADRIDYLEAFVWRLKPEYHLLVSKVQMELSGMDTSDEVKVLKLEFINAQKEQRIWQQKLVDRSAYRFQGPSSLIKATEYLDFISDLLDEDEEEVEGDVDWLDKTAVALLIRFMQYEGLFPYHVKLNISKKKDEEFISGLLRINYETVKKRFQKADLIISKKSKTKQSSRERLIQLRKIRDFVSSSIQVQSVIDRIDALIKDYEN